MLLLRLGFLLLHSSEGFSLQTCDAAETEGLVPTPAAQGLVEQSPDLVIAHCQHQGCVLPWEATFHIKSTFPLPHYFAGKGQKYSISKHHEDYTNAAAFAGKPVWTEQKHPEPQHEPDLAHTILTPTSPAAAAGPARSCCPPHASPWGVSCCSTLLLCIITFYHAGKRLHKSDENLELSEVRQVPAGRGRT